ncbi:3-hydroxyisobutyrate dehydrogenase [Glaciihabitans tibetensis]|uniref:3-hydroxyisobutyrate dehydrogenase n=1 Tax=Glaciihabitans tibetensis TaxID=1266600 RepID=A0A2T0V6U1_9MICO|nr:NAD(P)-dependent oxidoreductase [Glaciihabitans tibetensis]PRY65871.1 3-hydroxyisobutyrate dehydrogenase [Glaciihabitans tibetensis]
MTKITMLGVGRMGHELAVHLLGAGHQLTVWNRTGAATDRIVAEGATAATSAQDAVAGADIVMTVLFGPDTVRDVLMGETPVQFSPATIWLDVTTVAPTDAQEFEAWAGARAIRYVHSPVVGTLAPARAGTLGVLVGGNPDDINEVLPLVRLWSDPERIRIVDTAAAAATGKLIANLALGISLQGLVEALRLGAANNLTAAEVLAMLDKTALSFVAGMKGDMIRGGSFEDTQFSADLLAKDARLMIASAGAPLPAVTALLGSLITVQRAGDGDSDIAVITRAEVA